MKKNIKTLSVFLLAIIMLLGMTITSFAADSRVLFDNSSLITYEPGSVYTSTDLFDNLKGVMPGDVRKEEISVENWCAFYDYIKVYMRAVPHDEAGNPISPEVLKELQADNRKGVRSDLEYMYDFLKQLSMKVTQEGSVIYQESPDGLASNVYLGELRWGQKVNLEVELTVPIELGNEYMDRIGEVDWVFMVEGYHDPEPEPIPTPLPPSLPQTGDDTAVVPYTLLLVLSVCAMAVILTKIQRANNK